MNFTRLVLFIALFVRSAGPVHAEDAAASGPPRARFSDAGRVMVAGAVGGWWGSQTHNHPANWSVNVSPSVTYFVKDRIGLGVSPSIGKGNDSDGFRVRDLGLGLHGVFDIPLAERVSWLILPTLGYNHQKRDTPPFNVQALGQLANVAVLQSSTEQSFRFTMFVPVALHVSSSIVIGLGPYFTYDRLIGRPHATYGSSNGTLGGSQELRNPFQPFLNNYHVGVSSFIAASF
jgi:hypothetical protein